MGDTIMDALIGESSFSDSWFLNHGSNFLSETVQIQDENREEKSPSSTSPTSIIPQTLVKSANWIGQTSLSLSNQILPAGVSSGTAPSYLFGPARIL